MQCQNKNCNHLLIELTLDQPTQRQDHRGHQKILHGVLLIRQGYPPKVVDIGEDCESLSCLPFRSRVTLVMEKDRKLQEELQQERMDNVIQTGWINYMGILKRKVVPAVYLLISML